jgi:hypothetical protein
VYLVTAEPEEASTDRAFVPTYTAVVLDDATVVLDEQFENPSARRDAVVQLLLVNHDEVSAEEVDEILAPFGGANADEALRQVVALYAGYGVDVHLGEYQRDAGPAVLYTTFTDYGDGKTAIEHYPTREARLQELRQRAANLSEGYTAAFFDTADEETCKKHIEFALTPSRGRVFILEANRHDEGESYSYQTPVDTTGVIAP